MNLFKTNPMADITLCTNQECPLRSYCRRAVSPPNDQRQSYQRFELRERTGRDPAGHLTHERYCLHMLPIPDKRVDIQKP